MRARSTSIYTKRPYDKINDASRRSWEPGNCNSIPDLSDIPDLTDTPSLRKYHSVGSDPLFEDFGPMCRSELKDNFVGDYKQKGVTIQERHSLDSFNGKSRTSTFMSSLTFGLDQDLIDELQEIEEQKQKIFRGMMIGCRDSGKRSLINAMFPVLPPSGEVFHEKKAFDLVMKSNENGNCLEKFHFWMKEPTRDGKYPQCLLDTYYKGCSMFFFVYNVDDKSSFDCLEQELQCIRKALGTGKDLMLILVGNKKEDNIQRKVAVEEVESLKEKFDMKLSLEINITKETPLELKCLIECFLKEIP
jgi:hypothetical protein